MRKISDYSDMELFLAFSDKRKVAETAFTEFYARHSDLLWRYIRKIIDSSEDVNDIFQETFINFYESGKKKSHKITNPKSFLYMTARNRCINYFRDNKHHSQFHEGTYYAKEPEYEDLQLAEIIHREIMNMKIEDREPLILRVYQGLSISEISEITGKDEQYVRNRIWRARKKLVLKLKPFLKELKTINKIVLE